MPGLLAVATVNVNGLRAAARRGMSGWLAQGAPDAVCRSDHAPVVVEYDLHLSPRPFPMR